VKPAYFAQGLDDLDDDRTVLEELVSATGWDIPRSRNYLGRFLFSGDDVARRVAVLSGGERSRLTLACLIASRPNVLVMDEPTNHLDLPAREALEKALAEFTGTVIFVSHDRYFVERLADRVWELDSGRLVRFEGGYAEYRVWKAGRKARELDRPEPGPATAVRGQRGPVNESGGDVGRDGRAKLSKGRRARLERELADIEARIDRLERRRGELESLLADPDSFRSGKGARLDADYRQVLADLEEALLRWEEVAGRLSGGDATVPDDYSRT
jgi:ATP-binding cassette subfamily F protein 3